MNRVGVLLRDAWRLTIPYFKRSDERWTARLILLSIVVLALIGVGGNVLINFWYGQFYDAIQHKDLDGFVRLLLWYRWDAQNGFMIGFVPIVAPLVPLGGLQYYMQRLLQIRWRQWMTNVFLGEYLTGRAYYTMVNAKAQAQAIALFGANNITYLDPGEASKAGDQDGFERGWTYWSG